MFLGRYQALQVHIGLLLTVLAWHPMAPICVAEENPTPVSSALGGTPTRVDSVLPYSVVESLSLPTVHPLPARESESSDRSTIDAQTMAPKQLDWKAPKITDRSSTEITPPQQNNASNENSNPVAVKIASKPKAPAEPRELSFGPSLAINAKASDAKANRIEATKSDTDKQNTTPLLVQPKLTAIEPKKIEAKKSAAKELASDKSGSNQLQPIEDSELADVLIDRDQLSDQNLSLMEEAPNAEPEYEAKISPKSGVTVLKEPLKPLDRSMMNLRSRMRTVLSYYYNKPLNNFQNDPWEVMHSMLSYELHSRVLEGGERGKPITAIGHLCFNRPTGRKQMMYLNENGDLDVRVGVGLQGHKGQFLAMLAQCNVSPDYPIRVEGKEFTIRDLIESEQRTCYSKTELTFKLIGLGHYLASDATWLNDQGEVWDIPRLIKEERTQKIRGSACGGTHRLAGLSLAYRRREARGEPLDGEYLEAAKFVSEYQSYAFNLQNSDGSLSTEWFRGRGAEEDIERRIRTTGHLLEWLAYSLPDEQLTARPTVRAVSYLTSLLATYSNQDWHKGSIAHALHALVIYDKRVFQPHDEAEQANLAVNPSANRYRGYSIYRGVLRGQQAQEASGGFFGLFGNTRSTQRPSSGRTR